MVNVGDPRKKRMEIRRCRARGLLSFGRDDQLDEAERTAISGAGKDGRSDG